MEVIFNSAENGQPEIQKSFQHSIMLRHEDKVSIRKMFEIGIAESSTTALECEKIRI